MAARQKRDTFDVGGLAHERLFRIRQLGHFGFSLPDMPVVLHFYCDLPGLTISDSMDWRYRVEDPVSLVFRYDGPQTDDRYPIRHLTSSEV